MAFPFPSPVLHTRPVPRLPVPTCHVCTSTTGEGGTGSPARETLAAPHRESTFPADPESLFTLRSSSPDPRPAPGRPRPASRPPPARRGVASAVGQSLAARASSRRRTSRRRRGRWPRIAARRAAGPSAAQRSPAVRADRVAGASSPASAAALARRTRSNITARAPGVSRSSSMWSGTARAPRRRARRRHAAGRHHGTVGQQIGQREAPGQLVESGQPGSASSHRVRGDLHGRPVVRPQDEEPVGAGVAARTAGRRAR